VASHGFSAALLMAHTVSAAAILAQDTATPEDALRRLLDVVLEELERAEMSMSFFFGVVYPERRILRYANAGHPGAFVIPGDGGAARRLGATSPPLGLAARATIRGDEVPWRPGKDLLCLFTDGLTEARNLDGEPFGERRLLQAVVECRRRPAQEIVDHVFGRLDAFTPVVQDDRTLLLLRR
jgi:sigma-B regulation protein RsbU (phosphoserine phosphatase)